MGLGGFRRAANARLLALLCLASGRVRYPDGYHKVRVLAGPLRGTRLWMPSLERLSFALGTYEPHVVRALRTSLHPGAVVYDIGANLGYLALASAQMVGAGGRVFAFEADPRNVEALRRTVRDNRVSNVSIEAKAVAESSGTLEFATFPYLLVGRIADEATPRDAQIRSVESVSLDDFVAHGNPAPSLLKIDVEGAEARVLAGAENLLHEARPLLIVEVRPDSRAAVESLTSKCGYRGRPLHGAEGQVADMLYVARD